jgi:AraC-like DNA-binding protein
MPDLDGVDTLRTLRAVCGRIPAILVTEVVLSADELDRAFAEGFDGFIPKPIRRVTLLERIAAILGRRPSTVVMRNDQEKHPQSSVGTDNGQKVMALLERLLSDALQSDGGPTEIIGASASSLRVLALGLCEPRVTLVEHMTLTRVFAAFGAGSDSWRRVAQRESDTWHDRKALWDSSLVGPVIEQVAERLKRDVTNALSFSEERIVSSLDLSKAALARVLARAIGCSLRQMWRAARIQCATQALALTDEHVRQIAFQLGYTHATEFDRDFVRALNVAPTGFRRLLRSSA